MKPSAETLEREGEYVTDYSADFNGESNSGTQTVYVYAGRVFFVDTFYDESKRSRVSSEGTIKQYLKKHSGEGGFIAIKLRKMGLQ